MKQLLLVATILAFFTGTAFGQKGNIKGLVTDSTKTALAGSTILLNAKKDSVLVSYDITKTDGSFEVRKIPKGAYYVQISSIGYTTYQKDIEITDTNTDIDLGTISLSQDNRTNLDAVVVEEVIPIRMEGDTINYAADAFNVDRNDNVEQLLKKLPGVEVETDGSVKVMGKDVEKVEVDGKEFFGNDPTIATRNLPADAVDKVQVFDKMSERAEFTGIDDGDRSTTINLKLKEGKKSGYFGKVSAGGGTEQTYKGKANVNRFTKDSQVSAIVSLNNVNERTFSYIDYVRMKGGFGALAGGGGNITISEDAMGAFGGTNNGINKTGTAGANLNFFPGKKIDLHADYFYNANDNKYTSTLERQNFLETGSYDFSEMANGNNDDSNHRANLNLEWKLSKKTELEFRNNLNFADSKKGSNSNSKTFGFDESLKSTIDNTTNSGGDNAGFSNQIFYKQLFDKKGRSLFAEVAYDYNNSEYESVYNNDREFYTPDSFETINQLLSSMERETGFGGEISFTEPLAERQYIEVRYDYSSSDDDSDKDYFDILNGGGTYEPNTTLSNQYDKNLKQQNAGLFYRIVGEKHNLSLGGGMNFQNLKGKTKAPFDDINKQYNRFLPSLSWQYNITDNQNIRLNYNSNLRLPSITQLQPVPDSSNLTNIYIGNPNLEAQTSHSARLNYFNFDRFTFTNIFGMLSTTFSKNKITNSRTVDEKFEQTTRPVNVDNDFTANANLSVSRPIRSLKTRVRLGTNFFYNKGTLFLNGVENDVTRFNPTLRLNLSNTKNEKVDLNLGGRWRFNNTKYSENDRSDQNYLTQRYSFEGSYRFGKGWRLGSDMRYNIYSQETYGDENTFALWNASLSKNILENGRGRITLEMFDILGENTGISRSSDVNYTQQEISNTLGSHGMLSFSYNLSRVSSSGAIPPPPPPH